MEVVTPKATRRSTRLRVQIPVTMTSLDRRHAFVAECVVLVVSPQGAGLQVAQALPIETPVMLSGLPGGASASARVASCLPLGKDEKHYLIGISLYNPGNVWGIAEPPEDWECAPSGAASASAAAGSTGAASPVSGKAAEIKSAETTTSQSSNKGAWPYNIFSGHTEAHPGRK
jgi:hypothetical protein